MADNNELNIIVEKLSALKEGFVGLTIEVRHTMEEVQKTHAKLDSWCEKQTEDHDRISKLGGRMDNLNGDNGRVTRLETRVGEVEKGRKLEGRILAAAASLPGLAAILDRFFTH